MNRTPSRRFRPALNPLEPRDNPASLFTASGAAAGGVPLVEVDRPDGTALARFLAFEPTFLGGVRAAAGELDGNPNTVEVVAAAGPGGGPRIEVFTVDVATGQVATLADVFVFEPSFRDGVRVAVGNVGGGPTDKIILGTDPGGGPRVRVMQLAGTDVVPTTGPLADFFAFEGSFRGGVRVAAGDVDGNPSNGDELVVGAGSGGGPRVIAFRTDGSVAEDFFALPPGDTNGVNVSVVNGQIIADDLPVDVSQRNATLNADALAAAQAAAAAAAAAATATVIPSVAAPLVTTTPAFGTVLNQQLATPVVVGGAFGIPGLFSTNATSGMIIGGAATAPGLFSTVATSPFVIGTAATAPVTFGTAATTGVTLGGATTAAGLVTTTGVPPLVTLTTPTTAPGLFTTGFPPLVTLTTPTTAPGVFNTFPTTTGF